MSEVERIARIIARKLGHNDDTGMYWERYVLAARGIIEETPALRAKDEEGAYQPDWDIPR